MTIAQKLTDINDAKQAIKTAITNKGVDMTGVAFPGYAAKIGEITGGGGGPALPTWPPAEPTIDPWVRPADWLALPTVLPTETKFVGLVAIYPGENRISMQSNAAYTVDWGDGTAPTNHGASTTATKLYNFDDISAGTQTSEGFRQVIVTVTPQSNAWSQISLTNQPAGYNSQSYMPPWLDINASTTAGTMNFFFGASSQSPVYLQRVNLMAVNATPITISIQNARNLQKVEHNLNPNGVLNLTSAFSGCSKLQALPDFVSGVNLGSNAFSNCVSLRRAPAFGNFTAGSFDSMFATCRNLTYVPAYTFNSGSLQLSSFFLNCSNLVVAPPMTFATVPTSTASMFSGCSSLRAVPSALLTGVPNVSGMFTNCSSITDIGGDLSLPSATNTNSLFTGCSSLVSVGNVDVPVSTNIGSMFQNCTSLASVGNVNAPLATTMGNMFQNSTSLSSVGNIYAPLATIASSVFNSCTSIQSIGSITLSNNVTTFASMFSNCVSLREVPNIISSTTNLLDTSFMFNICSTLKTVPLFNTQSATTMNNMFSSCTSLETIPLFNTQSATNISSMFSSCVNLKNVPLFNTQSATNMSNIFGGCIGLKAIPQLNTATISSSSNSANMFSNCNSLQVGRTNGIRFAVNYSVCQLSQAQLVEIFNGLGTASGAQTITITSNPGAAALTAGERAIATGKGWTIAG